MIGRIKGILIEKQPPMIVVEAQGVGYEIYLPMTCFYTLPDIGQETVIYTHFSVREDAQLLYGFHHKQERALFKELIKVSGIGPKLALAILSGMSAAQFTAAVEREDIQQLVKLPGVGKKTAERLLVEMRDRLKQHRDTLLTINEIPSSLAPSSPLSNAKQDALSALVVLGYKPQEAERLLRQVMAQDKQCEQDSEKLIREALRIAL